MPGDPLAAARLEADRYPADMFRQMRLVALLNDTRSDSVLIDVGSSRLASGHAEAAYAAFAAASSRHPENARLALMTGMALEGMRMGPLAIASLRRAIALDPSDIDLVFAAGSAFVRLGQSGGGVAYMRRIVDIDFDNPARHRYGFVFPFLNGCDWTARASYYSRLVTVMQRKIKADRADFLLDPSVFTFLGASGEMLLDVARYYARHAFARVPRRPVRAPVPGDVSRPIRVGYLSNRLWDHHVGHSYIPMLENHDRGRVDPFLYSTEKKDAVQDELRRLSTFRNIDYADADATAALVAADGIDILVDLDGYVNEADPSLGLAVLARRAAPVQIIYHNYAGPTGATFVDYLMADSVLLPAGFERLYDEALIRLPPCHYPAALPPVTPLPSTRENWGLPNDGMVFANFGNFYKLEPVVFDVWLRILGKVPGSVLWLNDWGRPDAVDRLRSIASAKGIAPDRLVFSPRVDMPRHLGRLALADLFLDTFDYASGVSSAYGLWMGLPLLTVDGAAVHDNYVRHFGACFNAGVDMSLLSCVDVATYEAKAIHLGNDAEARHSARQRLERRRVERPAFDFAALAGRLEKAYEGAWARYCAGDPPTSFSVSD